MPVPADGGAASMPNAVEDEGVHSMSALVACHASALELLWRDCATSPCDFVHAVITLLSVGRLPATSSVNAAPFPRPGASLADYTRRVIVSITPILDTFPLCASPGSKPIEMPVLKFPSGSFVPKHPAPATQVTNIEPTNSIPRLRSNLEAAWDQTLVLQRKYRGDLDRSQTGKLDHLETQRAMAVLHPACMEAFSIRFLNLATRSLYASTDAPERMRRLDERLQTDGRTRGRPPVMRGMVGEVMGSVVLHRVPSIVRESFERETGSLLFFLDFVTQVDSARLNSALAPRLAAQVSYAVAKASSANSSRSFTDAVIEARFFAKLVSVVMHMSNWPYSASSLSGTPEELTVKTGLSPTGRALRVPVLSACWTALFDLHVLLRDAVQSGEVCALLVSVAVCEVMIRMAVVDPVARETIWFRNAVSMLASLQCVDELGDFIPVLRVLVGSVLSLPGVIPDAGITSMGDSSRVVVDSEVMKSVPDARFIRLFCPVLEDLRRELSLVDGPAHSRAGTKARRITPLAERVEDSKSNEKEEERQAGVSDEESDSVEAALRREFFERIDGRIRELVGVVAVARADNAEHAREGFLHVVGLLYPDTPQTVAAVAADVCARRVCAALKERHAEGLSRRPKVKVKQKVKRVPGLEERLFTVSLSGGATSKSPTRSP